ncbi:hypothetical protein Sa4125_31450 [Aureimonas sp. SA4125]|nr:hypothetical protein Sa4125_31450 [Aureimonas sp. SA4125]
MAESAARVPTANASRYLQQLCKHWADKLDVTLTPDEGTVRFPEAVGVMRAEPEALVVGITADDPARPGAHEGGRRDASRSLRLQGGAARLRVVVVLPRAPGEEVGIGFSQYPARQFESQRFARSPKIARNASGRRE